MRQIGSTDKGSVRIRLDKELNKSARLRFKLGKRAVAFFSLLIVLITFAVFFTVDNFSTLFSKKIELNADYQLLESDNNLLPGIIVPAPNPVKDKENPINGVTMTSAEYEELIKRHPIAIVINNHTAARPQFGLSKADIVMEVLAEGGITRYVPIFYQNYDVSKIGPVRSLRYYMIMFTSGFADAIILHEGWAGFDNQPDETYREQTDARGAVYKYHIKSIQSAASRYRDLQKARKDGYVHALYTDFAKIVPEIARLQKALNWKIGSAELQPIKFKYEDKLEDRGDFKGVSIAFLSLSKNDYSARFTYDKATNTYPRFIAGKADIDLLTNSQIAPKNVIIEWHNYSDANDGHGRIIIDMLGEDKAIILRDGKVIEGKWKKDERLSRTKYYTAEGEEIAVNRGQIWVVNVVKVGDRLVSNVNFD